MSKPIIIFTLVGLVIGYVSGAKFGGPAAEVGKDTAGVEPTALSSAAAQLERELRACRQTSARLIRDRDARQPPEAPDLNALIAMPAPAAVAAEPAADTDATEEIVLLRRDYLDERIEGQPEDAKWQAEVAAAVKDVLSAWPEAETISAQCSKALCRVDFTTGLKTNNLDAIMDKLNSIPEVQGERMIQIDDSVDPPFATAYFGRDGAISLAHP
jgi:hypothetical protein